MRRPTPSAAHTSLALHRPRLDLPWGHDIVAVPCQLRPGSISPAPRRSRTSQLHSRCRCLRACRLWLHLIWHPHGDVPAPLTIWILRHVRRRRPRGVCGCCLIFHQTGLRSNASLFGMVSPSSTAWRSWLRSGPVCRAYHHCGWLGTLFTI